MTRTSPEMVSNKYLRCSAWAQSESIDPVGTIGSYVGYTLVETPLPWPRDIGEIPEVAIHAGPAVRVQALVPSSSGSRSVITYRSDPDLPFAGYETEREGGDVLICTHGRRDICCGSMGTELAAQLLPRSTEATRFWRTSHTGGHRFAPTFLVLPEGTGWAFASPELVDQVLTRVVPFTTVAAHYRGCAGLPGPEVQAVERSVLCAVGWDLLDRPRSGFLTGETVSHDGQVARLDSGADRWEAVVRPARIMPVPDCTKPLSESTKTETEWSVTDLRTL